MHLNLAILSFLTTKMENQLLFEVLPTEFHLHCCPSGSPLSGAVMFQMDRCQHSVWKHMWSWLRLVLFSVSWSEGTREATGIAWEKKHCRGNCCRILTHLFMQITCEFQICQAWPFMHLFHLIDCWCAHSVCGQLCHVTFGSWQEAQDT